MPITASTDPRVLDPLLTDMTYRGIEESPELKVYEQVCNFKNHSESPIPDGVRTHEMFGLGAMQERGDTTPFTFDSFGSIGTKKRKIRFFALAAVFSEFMLDKDMYGMIPNVLRDLGRSYPLRRCINVAAFYDDAFTGSKFTTLRNQKFMQADNGVDTGHECAGAPGVFRFNALSTPAPVCYESLQAAIMLRQQHVNDRGFPEPLPIQGLRLHIPVAAMFEADRILDANSRLEPTSNNNAVNVIQKYAIQTIVNPYFGGTNWFLMDPANSANGGNPFTIYDDQPLTPDTDRDVNTKGVRHDVRARWTEMEGAWQTIFGSNG